jgi:hypothetical protein
VQRGDALEPAGNPPPILPPLPDASSGPVALFLTVVLAHPGALELQGAALGAVARMLTSPAHRVALATGPHHLVLQGWVLITLGTALPPPAVADAVLCLDHLITPGEGVPPVASAVAAQLRAHTSSSVVVQACLTCLGTCVSLGWRPDASPVEDRPLVCLQALQAAVEAGMRACFAVCPLLLRGLALLTKLARCVPPSPGCTPPPPRVVLVRKVSLKAS